MEPKTTQLESGLVQCEDGEYRPPWAIVDQLHQDYYDNEWGKAVRDERGVFERLSLEGFQVGLSWAIILKKRELIRELFDNFDPDIVAAYTDEDIDRIMAEPGMIHNERKIRAVVSNAAITVGLRGLEYGSLQDLIWSFAPTNHNQPTSLSAIAKNSAESTAMAAKLKELGFSFVGPTTCYALMQAIGLVNDRVEPPQTSEE